MICLSCKSQKLKPKELTEGLFALSCSSCEGVWLEASKYWAWKKKLPKDPTRSASKELKDYEIMDSKGGKFCPSCQKLLFPYQIHHQLSFRLERCHQCGGIWFDRNEWEAIEQKGLHLEIHRFFSTPWQKSIHKAESQEKEKERLKQKLGPNHFEALEELLDWATKHSHKTEILAYIRNQLS